MSDPTKTIAWLADLQQRFGSALRTPLDRSTGSLRALTRSYDATLCRALLDGPHLSARDRLAVYHRQYWYRLFTTLQTEYALTARLTGMWSFNELAARYLARHPPSAHDLRRIADHFVTFLHDDLRGRAHFGNVPVAALLEAATLDLTYARVFFAPEVKLLDPARLAEGLASRRLKLSPAVCLVEEHWPLVTLRRTALTHQGDGAIPLPPRLEAPQYWAILRNDEGHGLVELDERSYRLFNYLSELPVGEALATLEAGCDGREKPTLPARVQRWLRESMRAGFWVDD